MRNRASKREFLHGFFQESRESTRTHIGIWSRIKAISVYLFHGVPYGGVSRPLGTLADFTVRFCFLLAGSFFLAPFAGADDGSSTTTLEYRSQIRPLIELYCYDCHSGETTEADIDLGTFATQADLARSLGVWLKVRSTLDSGQMPPKESKQPRDDERELLQTWVRAFLDHHLKNS